MQVIATNIRQIIKKKGYKQKTIAERAGFSENEFSAMLNGRKSIKAEYVPLIAVSLGVTPNELFATE